MRANRKHAVAPDSLVTENIPRGRDHYVPAPDYFREPRPGLGPLGPRTIARAPVWSGTRRALGDEAIAMRKRGEIAADSNREAIRILCARFVDKNGNPINPKNVFDSLVIRRKFEGKSSKESGEVRAKIAK
jgi:hypothetical protein